MKKPAPFEPAKPPPDDPEKRSRDTDSNEDNSALAARKRLEALEAIKRGQTSRQERTDGQESGKEKPGSQEQSSKK